MKILSDMIAMVDDNDDIIGFADKMIVHRNGLLHRAFSIQIIHPEKGFLLQKRAFQKYHSPGLWTNTCCSHLPEGMEMAMAIHQRLYEEMGFDCELNFIGKFSYKANFENGLSENEIDHVYLSVWDGTPIPNPKEVDSFTWVLPDMLKLELMEHPQNFTAWFPHVFKIIRSNPTSL
jgi:isopentenyl-diphosphate Delta-isomerase